MKSVSISPMLAVRGGAKAIDYYKAAFGATEAYRIDDPDGAVVARLAVEGAEFWVHDESLEHGSPGPESLGGSSFRMILVVPDPDAVFSKAVSAGGIVVSDMVDAHGWRTGRLIDPFGHQWEIGRKIESKLP